MACAPVRHDDPCITDSSILFSIGLFLGGILFLDTSELVLQDTARLNSLPETTGASTRAGKRVNNLQILLQLSAGLVWAGYGNT